MEKEIVSIDVDEEFDTTEVTIRVPNFDNFGRRLEELEQLAADAVLADDDVEGPAAGLKANPLSHHSEQQLRDKIALLPEGPEKESLRTILENVRRMKERIEADDENEAAADDDDDEPEDDDPGEEEYDPELLVFAFSEGVGWDDDAERKVDRFLRNWPALKAKVLNAMFEVYQSVYPVMMEFVGDDPSIPYFLPEPGRPESIEDHFLVETVFFRADKKIGLSGYCTWDDELGWGALLKDGAVISAGGADEIFS
jgi:hypothetical protein